MPDNTLNCVVFVGARTATGIRYGGTAFYVGVPPADGGDDKRYLYLVTAKHNIESALIESTDGKILIRPSWLDPSRSTPVETVRSEWVEHPDADVALLDFDVDGVRWSAVEYSMLLTDPVRAADKIGPGDELQITGLFARHPGTSRNVPTLRSGIISAMPDAGEPVDTRLGPMEAYLAEVRSLGGLSGSPVFVVLPPGRTKQSAPSGLYQVHLLGLVHGHWDITAVDTYGGVEERINQGIAVIVPSTKILDLIDAPAEKRKRTKANKPTPADDA